jgi:hypothetical protein
MPRDGSNIYHTPAGTAAVTNTTIASTPYNGYLSDIEQDLNLPRPIVAGGTGANNAAQAMVNLGGQLAGQVVTNYDSFPFASGSFISAGGATSAPTANAQRGIAYITDANNITVEARDNVTAIKYIRQKTAGSWGSWNQDLTANPAYVLKAGDTMTGDLKLTGAGPDFILSKNSGTAGTQCNIWGQTNNVPRWLIQLGNEANESGSNVGSDFTVQRYSDAGAFLGNALSIARNTGFATFPGNVITSGGVFVAAFTPTTGSIYFGTSVSKYLTYDGSFFQFNGGDVKNTSNFITNNSLGFASGAYLFNAGGDFTFSNAKVNFGGTVSSSSGYQCRAGTGGTFSNIFNLFYVSGTGTQLWIDNTNMGVIAFTSDYRVKKDVIDLPAMWDTVKQLRPIKYSHKDFTPPSHQGAEPFFHNDDIERWGFIAHELQQALIPSAASGVKDAPGEMQSPNPLTVIAALTKALQEAMGRIEALEARG